VRDDHTFYCNIYKELVAHTLAWVINLFVFTNRMTGTNWAWFGSWLGLGLIVYFSYGYWKSKLTVS
jgi:hypothetical protein